MPFVTCIQYTVKKAEHVEGPKHVGDEKFRNPHRRIGKIRQQHTIGPLWLTEFSVTYEYMFWSCATLGLSNSVYTYTVSLCIYCTTYQKREMIGQT
jgi:hypothetical protein